MIEEEEERNKYDIRVGILRSKQFEIGYNKETITAFDGKNRKHLTFLFKNTKM